MSVAISPPSTAPPTAGSWRWIRSPAHRKTDFKPKANASVRAIVATASTVYLGGYFSTVNGSSRAALGAVKASGSLNTTWKPVAGTGHVNAMVISPDNTKIVIGGSFKTLNKSSNPGYGLGQVKSTTGANLPFPTNSVVRNGGTQSAILSLATDATNIYGTGYVFGAGGDLEGSFSTKWSDGKLNWLEDCHGDSYGIFPGPQAVYVASHSHSCANIPGEGSAGRGFPNMPKGTGQRAIAFSRTATGTVTVNAEGNYHNFAGKPAPSLLNFFPQLTRVPTPVKIRQRGPSRAPATASTWSTEGSSSGSIRPISRAWFASRQGHRTQQAGPESHRDFVVQPIRAHVELSRCPVRSRSSGTPTTTGTTRT